MSDATETAAKRRTDARDDANKSAYERDAARAESMAAQNREKAEASKRATRNSEKNAASYAKDGMF